MRVDQVLLDDERALVALLAFSVLGRARHGCDLVLVAPAREADGPDAGDDLRYLQDAAAAIGATFARPGAGPPAALHRRACAACGRTLLADAPGAGGAGALATLVLDAGATETAAVLAGDSLRLARPRVVGVRLAGELTAGCGGAEALLALERRLEGAARGAVVEYTGPAVASVPMPERVAMAALGRALLGACASVWPADERTRAYLAARGRDADWRALAGGGEGFDLALELDLARLEPPPRSEARLRFGPNAEDDDVRALAAAGCAGAALAGVEVVVGGRAARRSLAAGDALAALEAAGARVLDAADGRARAPLEPGAWACGDEAEVEALRARPLSAAGALARLGVTVAPPGAAADAALAPGELLAGGDGAAPERGPGHAVLPLGAPPPPALRGSVWRYEAPDLPGERVLAWGPRAQRRRGDAAALAALAFGGEGEAALAEPAARFLATPGRYGEGGVEDAGARAVAALGVRAVLAGSFAPAALRALAVHGVLPLTWRPPESARWVAAGDELELPGLAEALARGGPVVVRSLTQGRSLAADVATGPEWRAALEAGGLLALLARHPGTLET